MTEKEIMRDIQVAASTFGARVFRNNVGVLKDERGEYVRYGLCPGSSDLIGWTKDGRFLAIEVKTRNGRVTPEQQSFVDAVRAAGGIGLIARSVEDATAALKS